MTEESSDSQYYSENYKTSELETLKDTLNNHDIEWPEVVYEKECSSASSSCFLASISECYDESNESSQQCRCRKKRSQHLEREQN